MASNFRLFFGLCPVTLRLLMFFTSTAVLTPALAKTTVSRAAIALAKPAKAEPVNDKELLLLTAGNWNTRTEFRKEPGTSPITTIGDAKISINDGDRLLHEQSTRKQEKGEDILSEITITYDKVQKIQRLELNDTLGTFGKINLSMVGAYDSKTKSYTFTGSLPDPIGSKAKAVVLVPVKLIIKNISQKEFKKEFWVGRPAPDGRQAKILEVKYARATTKVAGT